jgi:hypothetical protein
MFCVARAPLSSLYLRRSNTYSALNAVAGHYNNFGTKYPLPAKRAERALKARALAVLRQRTHASTKAHF